MSHVNFDFERLRHNWDRARAASATTSAAPGETATTGPALTPWASADVEDSGRAQACQDALGERQTIEATWRHVKALIARDYAPHAAALEIFVSEVERLLTSSTSLASAEPKLRLDLEAALADLEDLLEVYGGFGRP